MSSLTIRIIKSIGSYKENSEKRLPKCNHGYKKMLHVYISVTVTDRPIVAIIDR